MTAPFASAQTPPQFGPPIVFPTGQDSVPFGLAAGDIDNDGDLDIAITDTNFADVRIFRNRRVENPGIWVTNPTAALEFVTSLVGTCVCSGGICHPEELSFGNFEFPGHPVDNFRDLAVVYTKQSTAVAYFRNLAVAPPGTPAFSEEQCQSLSLLDAGVGIAVADWDSDGKDDVAVAGIALFAPQLPRIGMLWNNTGGVFTSQYVTVSGPGNVGHGYDLARGYFGGLGRAPVHPFDLAMSNDSLFVQRTHIFKDSSGETVNYHDSWPSVRSYGIAAGPLDGGNSLYDLATTDADNNQLRWLQGNGTGTFTLQSPPHDLPNTNANPRAVAIGKLNADNWQDVVVANLGLLADPPNGYVGSVTVFINQNGNPGAPGGLFGTTSYTFSVGPGDRGPVQVVLSDMDGDTHLDIVVTNYRASSITVLINSQ